MDNESSDHSLHRGALGAADSIVMAVAGSAPAYSLTATTASLVAAVGLAGPGALLWCGIPMLGIALAFSYLGKADVNAGAAYSWVRRAIHPSLGFFAGWALVVSATIFMVAACLPAGQATISLFTSSTPSTGEVTGIGAVWFLVMVGLVVAGVKLTTKAQWIMSSVEILILLVVLVIALFHTSAGRHGTPFTWSWFSPSQFHSVSGFAAGALVAAFYYWGWDVTSNLNEESKQSRLNALGGIIGVVIVFLLFEVYTIITNVTLPASTVNGDTNVLSDLGVAVGGSGLGKVMVIAVMLSTIATLETTLIQVSRSLFAMGRDNSMPKVFGSIHKTRRTPAFATLVVAVVSLALFVGSNLIQGSVGTIMNDAILAIGVQIAVYYSLAALSVVIAYRAEVFKSAQNVICIGLLPLIGALFMLFTLEQNLVGTNLDTETKVIALVALGIGLIPLGFYWAKKVPYYVKGATLASETELATLVEPDDLLVVEPTA
ncbi:MAG TPA: APC family permease [Actinocrinis sp.]|nr:APC family permease [Actinocrinis sp.]